MKISTFQGDITPPIGTELAGYGAHEVSVAVHDPLTVHGILLDDRATRALLMSFDLLGMDGALIREIREACAAELGIPPANVLLTNTHTHGGPHTRTLNSHARDPEYSRWLVGRTVEALRGRGAPEECQVFWYSGKCDANINRRVVNAHNDAIQLSDCYAAAATADGFCDREVGMLLFVSAQGGRLRHLLVNYAAHPLASHARGSAGLMITADYPAVVREMVEEATGAGCTFATGAAGDQFPKDAEVGFEALRPFAYQIARTVMQGALDAIRNPQLFRIAEPTLQVGLERFTATARGKSCGSVRFPGGSLQEPEVQLLAFGREVCLVGVPGELLAEVGQEIKWHSPFRKAFILYNATEYFSYICHGNAFVAGSYEAESQILEQRASLKLLNCAIDGMYRLLDAARG